MDKEFAACKARLIKAYARMAKEYEQTATDLEYGNRNLDRPIDVGPLRLKAHAAREALRAVREDRPIEPRWQELLGLNGH